MRLWSRMAIILLFIKGVLGSLNICGVIFAIFGVTLKIKIDLLPLFESTHSGAFNGADMDEYISIPIIQLNETKTSLIAKPLHGSSNLLLILHD